MDTSVGEEKSQNWGALEEMTWACLAREQSCRQAMYTGGDTDSCEFFKALEKARMFWYNPSILPNQACRTLNRQATLKRVAGRSEVGAIGLELITRRSLVQATVVC